MSFQWTFLASFLYCELVVVIILLLPFISPSIWQRFFKSRLAKGFQAGAKYYFNFIICIFALLFADSIRELRKYAGVEMTDRNTPQAEVHAHMKQFRSQRNFYIAGFALFLWFVIKRLINLLSDVAREMADSDTVRKQIEKLASGDLSKIDPRDLAATTGNPSDFIDAKEHEAEVSKLKQQAVKGREDIETLREQYETSVTEYDKLKDEHKRLQDQLAIFMETETAKDK